MSLGGGVLAGVAVGVALRTALKWALIVVGLILLLLVGLMQAGYITVDWGAITQSVQNGAEAAGGYVQLAVADLSAQIVGFSGGVLMGWKLKL